jgi:serine/threonine protein phosphatase PrpC
MQGVKCAIQMVLIELVGEKFMPRCDHQKLTAHCTGSVNVSRALGDLDFKKPPPGKENNNLKNPSHPLSTLLGTNLAKAVGLQGANDENLKEDWISNVPHTDYHSLTGVRRGILLLASDGLGEEKDCSSCLTWALKEWEKGRDATWIAETLAGSSSRRTKDNSTAVVVVFE